MRKAIEASLESERDAEQARGLAHLHNHNYPDSFGEILELLSAHGTNVEQNLADPTGDGDQSPITPFSRDPKSDHAWMRSFWSSGGGQHMDPFIGPGSDHSKDMHRSCFTGQFQHVKELLDAAKSQTRVRIRGLTSDKGKLLNGLTCKMVGTLEEYADAECIQVTIKQGEAQEVKSIRLGKEYIDPESMEIIRTANAELLHELLEGRVGTLRQTPLIQTVTGAKLLAPENQVMSPEDAAQHYQWGKIAKLLLASGANPCSKDCCGKTIVHYGAGLLHSPSSLETVRLACRIARRPEHNNVDLVNVKDRFGETALSMVVQAGDLDVVKVLCELGADPMSLHMDLETTPLGMSMPGSRMRKVLEKAVVNKRRKRECGWRGCKGVGEKELEAKCGGCQTVYYCSKTCQRK